MRFLLKACLILVSAAVVFAGGQQLDAVSATLGPRLQAAGRKTVAVVDFTDLQGNATELGRYLAEELSVTLANSGKGFTVIDRTHLKALLQENKLGSSGVIDSQTARQLGRIAGVDTLITGTLTPFGDSVRLSVKALDAQTAGMLAATTAEIPRTKAIDELLNRSVGASSETQSRSAVKASAPALQRVQGAGVTLELESCQRSGTCRLFVTAEQDTKFSFEAVSLNAGPVRAWDESGNVYEARTVRVGNQDWRAELIAGVRTPVTIGFEFSSPAAANGSGVGRGATRGAANAAELTSLSAIEVSFNGVDRRSATLRFRNIPVR